MAQEVETNCGTDPVNRYSSAALAFLGDSVFELQIRAQIVSEFRGNAGSLNNRAKFFTNARTQARIAEKIQDILTEEERSVYKRGRNYRAPSVPRSCTPSEYRKATGLEALMGYLYVTGQQERIDELIRSSLQLINDAETPGRENDERKQEI